MECYENKKRVQAKVIVKDEVNKKINVLWLDTNYDNIENSKYLKKLESNENLKINCFKEADEGIEYIKKINFEETYIIISGRLYSQFITKFKKHINKINVIPKIIVFTKKKSDFYEIKKNKNLIDDNFYGFGGVETNFKNIKQFILKPLANNISFIFDDNKYLSLTRINNRLLSLENNNNFIFEYIDCQEKLYLPVLYQSLIDNININKIDSYTESLYNIYQNNSDINKLLYPILHMVNIPIEILSKYYARLYTAESSFYININKDLRENKKDNYLSYIKVLYEGIKTKSFSPASNNILYRGTRLLIKGIEKIKNYLKNKKKGLPGAIVFSKTFLSFSKDINIAENFLSKQENNNELIKVLFTLEKDKNINFSLLTHADIEKISFYPLEQEVLFLPFSSFEIKDMKEVNTNDEKRYEIKLLYLGKYLKKLEKNKNIEKIIPNSEFKKQIIDIGLIEKTKTEVTPKYILQKFDEYKEEIKKNNNVNEVEIKDEEEKKENNDNSDNSETEIKDEEEKNENNDNSETEIKVEEEKNENSDNREIEIKNEEDNNDKIETEIKEEINNKIEIEIKEEINDKIETEIKEEINENKIINDIEIKDEDINKDIRIINSYEKHHKENQFNISNNIKMKKK